MNKFIKTKLVNDTTGTKKNKEYELVVIYANSKISVQP